MLRIALAAVLAMLLWPPGFASAEAYPSKPIKIIVPLAAGSGWDVRVRQLAEAMAKSMGTPIVIDNRPGAGATIGATAVAQSAPDGYTLLASTQADQAIAQYVYPSLPYDPAKDFVPVAPVLFGTAILVVNSSLPITSFTDLVALARRNPGTLTAGSYGHGTYTHIWLAEINRAIGIDIIHVPYKKSSDALSDVVAGRISMMVDFYVTSGPYIKSGKLKAVLAAGPRRHRALPSVPSTSEIGMQRMARRPWGGLVAPAGTPPGIVQRLNQEVAKALRTSELRKAFEDGGSDVFISSPEEFGVFLKKEREDYRSIIEASHIRLE